MQDGTIKHMEFVQAIVTRMGGNSFLLKGWTVTLTAALFALAAKDSNSRFVVVAILPAFSFWGLDAYYLRQERLFRCLYDDLRLVSDDGPHSVEPFSLSTAKYAGEARSWFRTLWEPTILAVHGIIVAAIVAVLAVAYFVR